MNYDSEKMSPVQVRKKVGVFFARGEKIEIDPSGAKLFVEAVEMKEMLFGSPGRVFRSALGLDEESPIARLRDQQFARGLSQGAFGLRIAPVTVPVR